MDIQAVKEFLERQSVDDLQSTIALAQQRIQQIKENISLRKAKIFKKRVDKQQDLWYTLGTLKERTEQNES